MDFPSGLHLSGALVVIEVEYIKILNAFRSKTALDHFNKYFNQNGYSNRKSQVLMKKEEVGVKMVCGTLPSNPPFFRKFCKMFHQEPLFSSSQELFKICK